MDIPDYDCTSNIFYKTEDFVGDFNTQFSTKTTDNLIEGVHNKFITDGLYTDDLTILGTLTVSKLEVLGIDIYNNIYNTNTAFAPFYMSLYLSTNITITDTNYHQLSYNINNSNISELNCSTNNAENYWINNYFVPPYNGIYSINYSIMGQVNSWINKDEDFNNNRYRFSMNFNENLHSSSYILNTKTNDKWTFITQSTTASILNQKTIYNNYYNYGETKADIILLQKI